MFRYVEILYKNYAFPISCTNIFEDVDHVNLPPYILENKVGSQNILNTQPRRKYVSRGNCIKQFFCIDSSSIIGQ